ncbi:MAG: hypothetical protein ACOC4D_02300 [Bacteroidota bacterium]
MASNPFEKLQKAVKGKNENTMMKEMMAKEIIRKIESRVDSNDPDVLNTLKMVIEEDDKPKPPVPKKKPAKK